MVAHIAYGLVVVLGQSGNWVDMKWKVDHKNVSYHEIKGAHVNLRSYLGAPYFSMKKLDSYAI